MDRIKQAVRTLCCWGDAPASPAVAQPAPAQGSSSPSLSSPAALSTATSRGHARRQQITENQATTPTIARTEEDVPVDARPSLNVAEEEVRSLPGSPPTEQGSLPLDAVVPQLSLPLAEPSDLNTARQAQAGRSGSTLSSPGPAEFSITRSSSSFNLAQGVDTPAFSDDAGAGHVQNVGATNQGRGARPPRHRLPMLPENLDAPSRPLARRPPRRPLTADDARSLFSVGGRQSPALAFLPPAISRSHGGIFSAEPVVSAVSWLPTSHASRVPGRERGAALPLMPLLTDSPDSPPNRPFILRPRHQPFYPAPDNPSDVTTSHAIPPASLPRGNSGEAFSSSSSSE